MISNSLKDYLIQTQQLFGDDLILPNIDTDFFIETEGNLESKILFIKESSNKNNSNKEEKILFSNILKALNLSLKDIFLISILENQKINTFNSFSSKIKPLIIIVFGSCISKDFLKNFYQEANIIHTHSLLDMINNLEYKKDAWKNLKPILTILK
jgi:DNA polymerase III psi subunit